MIHTITRKHKNSKSCFVCGLKNDSGLKASFYETDNLELVAVFMPLDEHQSYPGRLHGGIASTILDETMCRAIMVGTDTEIWGVTLELAIKYKKPIPLGVELKAIARITDQTNRYFKATGEIVLHNGEVAVTAQGKYLKTPLEKIAEFDPIVNEWKVVENEKDPIAFTL